MAITMWDMLCERERILSIFLCLMNTICCSLSLYQKTINISIKKFIYEKIKRERNVGTPLSIHLLEMGHPSPSLLKWPCIILVQFYYAYCMRASYCCSQRAKSAWQFLWNLAGKSIKRIAFDRKMFIRKLPTTFPQFCKIVLSSKVKIKNMMEDLF